MSVGKTCSIVHSKTHVGGRYLAVAKPTFSLEQFPTAEDIEVFQIEG